MPMYDIQAKVAVGEGYEQEDVSWQVKFRRVGPTRSTGVSYWACKKDGTDLF